VPESDFKKFMAFQTNWMGMFKAIPQYLPNALFWQEYGIHFGMTGLNLSVFNAAILPDFAMLTPELLDLIHYTFDPLNVPFSIQFSLPSLAVNYRDKFPDHIELFADPMRICNGLLTLPALNPLVHVTHVQDESQAAIFFDMVIQGFDLLPSANEFMDLMLRMKESYHVIAFLEDEPVGAGSLIMCDGVAGVYNVTTIPYARRQGVAVSIMANLHDHALAQGYPGTALASSVMGLGLYQRLGYQPDGYQVAFAPTSFANM
jgi:Acetyltransferase (GNAT) domain